MEFIPVLVLILLVIYLIKVIMNPEKHKVAFVIFAIIAAIIGIASSSDKKR